MRFFILNSILLVHLVVFSQTYSGGNGPILDLQTIDIPLTVSGAPTVIDTVNYGLEQLCLDLTHTYDSDLQISLIAPDGTTVMLISGVGGSGDNMQNTCLRWDVSNAIASGSAPFNGIYKPMGQMGLVNNGQNPNGTWYLRIYDAYNADQGFLNSWSMTFGNNPADYFAFNSSDLPIVVINTNGQTIVNEPKIEADMGIIWNGSGNRNYMTDPYNDYNGKIGIEIRGNFSASLPQKPYTIRLQDILGNQLDSSLIGMPAEHDWLLIASYNDKSFARNILPYQLFDEIGHYAPRHRLVDVVINGEYRGIYLLTEKIKKDNNRVDVADIYPWEITYPEITGGYILKFDYWNSTNSWLLNYSPIDHPGYAIHMVYVYPKPDVIVGQQQAFIQDYIDQFETALYGPNFDDPVNGFRKFISVRSWLDYFIVNEVARNGDGFKKSYYFNKEKDPAFGVIGKLKAGPVWDFDWAWKDMWDCMYNTTDGSNWAYLVNDCNPDVKSPGWYVRMFQDTVFQNEMRCRYEDLRRNYLSESYLHSIVDSVALTVDESQAWHYQTWGNMGVATGTPEVQAPSQTYAEEVQRLKDWIDRRLLWLDDNMPGTLYGCSMTALEEISLNTIVESYPNPFTSSFVITVQEVPKEEGYLRLIDATGRVVFERTVKIMDWSGNNLIISDLDHLLAGAYHLEFTASDHTSTLKVMKN